jgi:hypothetical protein
MEKLSTIFFGAGFGFFGVAFVLSFIFPWATLSSYHGMDFRPLERLAERPVPEFFELAETYPGPFAAAFGEPTPAAYGKALQLGRDTYVAEACWHCHSQFVRPVASEEDRWGAVSSAQEYQNELNLPHLWGTRRVGPDLARVGGRLSNDWHAAHLYDPRLVVPESVMPSYPWLFGEGDAPNERGLALITYLQWLGSESRRVGASAEEGTDAQGR